MLFSALWKNQCWICHRIRCITKFFTEFGAEQCTFSFTGGYSAHTSQSRDVEEVWKVLDPNWFKIQLEKHFSLVGIFSSHSWSDRKENLDFINFKIKTEKTFPVKAKEISKSNVKMYLISTVSSTVHSYLWTLHWRWIPSNTHSPLPPFFWNPQSPRPNFWLILLPGWAGHACPAWPLLKKVVFPLKLGRMLQWISPIATNRRKLLNLNSYKETNHTNKGYQSKE